MFKFTDPSRTFVTSDTHAFHKNICKGCTNWDSGADRDFDDPLPMTIEMAARFNAKVPTDATLLHLGDWSFGGKDKVKKFRDMINCKNIYFIGGNHDENIEQDYNGAKSLFTKCWCDADIAYRVMFKVGQFVYDCGHFKPAVWDNSHKKGDLAVRALWGHSHGSMPDDKNQLSFDVGVDCHGLAPLSFVEVEANMATRTNIPVDHHNPKTFG